MQRASTRPLKSALPLRPGSVQDSRPLGARFGNAALRARRAFLPLARVGDTQVRGTNAAARSCCAGGPCRFYWLGWVVQQEEARVSWEARLARNEAGGSCGGCVKTMQWTSQRA